MITICELAFIGFIQPVQCFTNWLGSRMMSVKQLLDNETVSYSIQPIFDWEDEDVHDSVSNTFIADEDN